MTKLYRDAEKVNKANAGAEFTDTLKAQSLAELVDYIESQRNTNATFSTSELCNPYSARLKCLCVHQYVHTTRQRETIL